MDAHVRGTDGPVRGTDPRNRNRGPFDCRIYPLLATVPVTALIVGAPADLLRNGQNIGPQLA